MHCKTLYRTVALAHANKRRGVTPRGYTNAIATACANTPAAVCRAIAEAPLQVRQRDARRTDTRRSWCVCDDRVRMYAELSLQARFPKHGGLTPAAPGACAFVHRKSRNSVGGRTRANRSGGRESPVVRETAIRKTIRFPFNGGRHNSGCGNAIARASANTPTTVFRTIAIAPLQVRFPNHGRLTPAAPAFARDDAV